MSSQLSELDFQRLQETLLELKTRNYTLEDQSRKQRSALGDATAKVTVLQQELQKAKKTIEKSKKLTEVQKVVIENENLHKKILAQEEDFRLQNQTLLNELSLLVTANERLEKQTAAASSSEEKNGNEPGLEDVKYYRDELQREVEKNSNLQDEISALRQKELERITDEFSLEDEDISFKNLKDKENIVADYKQLKEEVDKERFENKLTKEKLQEVQENFNRVAEENEKLKNATSLVEEKLKKKQAVFADVQTEKDKTIEKLNSEIMMLKEKIEKELSVSSAKEKESNRELQGKVLQLQNKLEASGLENERNILKTEKLQIDFDKLSIDLSDKMSQIEELNAQNSKLALDLDGQKNVSEKRKNLIDEMALEIQKKIEEQQEKSVQYNLSLAKLTEEKSEEITELEMKITELNEEIVNLKLVGVKYEEQKEAIKMLKKSNEDLQSNIAEYKESLEELKVKSEADMENQLKQNSEEKEQLHLQFENKRQEFELQLELINVQKCEFEETVSQLKQEIKDNLEERKISEKKGNSLVKDLKRQLQSEKNKNEKLQEKLNECLESSAISEPSRGLEVDVDRTSVSSWSLMSGQNERDSSTPNQLSASPFHSSNGIINDQYSEDSPHDLTQENEALLARISKLQQEKWVLEEKLSMLEQSGGEMAEELVSKTKLIQQYCMDTGAKRGPNRSTPSTPSSDKVKTFVDKLDKFVNLETQKESLHKKEVSNMQKMLEETLLKNMHLQQDLENMSLELVRLSKLAVAGGGGDTESVVQS